MTIVRVIDVETTGMDPDVDRIVEVATVDVNVGDDGDITRGRTWSSLINPGKSIPPEASAIHHITDEMVASAPTIYNVMPKLTDGAPTIYAAHNAVFERSFIDLRVDWICTYKVAIQLWPDCPSYSVQCLRYWLKLKLSDPAPPHRALGDAYVAAAVLRRAMWCVDGSIGDTIQRMVEMSNQPVLLNRFGFGAHRGKAINEVPSDYLTWLIGKGEKQFGEDVIYTAQYHLSQREAA